MCESGVSNYPVFLVVSFEGPIDPEKGFTKNGFNDLWKFFPAINRKVANESEDKNN